MKAGKNTIRGNHHRYKIPLIMLTTIFAIAPLYSSPVNTPTQNNYLFLILMHGVSGSGKSTLARWLEQETGAVWVSSDVERKRLFKLQPEENSHEKGLNIYTTKASYRTFRHIERLTHKYLQSGQSVILDATFLQVKHREPYLKLAKDLNAKALIISCEAPDEELVKRVRLRKSEGTDPSEATESIVKAQLKKFQPIPAKEGVITCIDTTRPFSEQQLQARAELKKLLRL